METSPPVTARARLSCQRCHRRKKKCDRTLPQCENCMLAEVACSFLDEDRENQMGSYPIAFVQGLQTKIQELEEKVFQLSQTSQPKLNQDDLSSDMELPLEDLDMTSFDRFQFDNTHDMTFSPMGRQARSPSLVEELKLLSLEATAERHLGNSSGVTFAKLTQMVLLRLAPDKAEFVFDDSDDSAQPTYDPSAETLDSILNDFNSSLSCYPTLYTNTFSLSNITESADVLAELQVPTDPHLTNLVDFYFAHSHTLYPFINRTEFLSTLERIRTDPNDLLVQSPLCMFRVWMVLAIGATTYCSVTLNEESEPMSYYNKAMLYLEAALGYGDMVTLEVLMLQVSYSFFNQLGPNTWFLVGVAARIAIGMGFHTSSSYDNLPTDVVERRKRLFFSIYMMDRVVSMALGRPCAIHDDDIDVTPFLDIEDENLSLATRPLDLHPSTMSIPLHILALRRIASTINRKVYSTTHTSNKSPQEREAILHSLHKDLIEWRRSTPFPLPDTHPQVPHMSGSWYDFNFYTHLALLYRPSPLFPTLDSHRVKILADAAANSIRHAMNMHRQHRFAYNWLNFLSLFTATLSLVYAITAFPENLQDVLKRYKVVADLENAMELFGVLERKFGAAKKISGMVGQILVRYREICDAK
ncbi:hypothetical protein P280DRAFT_518088 [Massarina eburnea CBS 473.64]|uniref:Zn(2)-C6 fungal-type domain-containing protein n=1 Tax=Massarina eburnea CBS 473.64 TaxID=1395130 RepID=A0A6A6S3A2_9PLEO|nr:hypothetical protein P280DRAFT_518088 [Massarina eburnea CBS 473.64]